MQDKKNKPLHDDVTKSDFKNGKDHLTENKKNFFELEQKQEKQ